MTANAPVDSVQEMRIETANPLSAEGRGSGAMVQLTTKSGSNKFHGSAYEYNRTAATEANDFFNNRQTPVIPKPSLTRNQFGASLGGPIKKDKLFFFFNYEGRRDAYSDGVDAIVIPPFNAPDNQNGILPTMSNQPLRASTMKDPVSWLYPPIEPYRTGKLQVSPVHELYFEESGNASGKPVIFLHGGPGGGSDPKQRRFFHPEKYRIVNFDQRGCGKSTPYASLEANTTWDLVSDIEKIREHLSIGRWQVFGGSWGSTLALAYSQTHPERVTELILRGIFLLRKQEIDWFYQHGASILYPDAWEPYLAHIPEPERNDLLSAYYRRLTSDDPAVRLAAAKVWSRWEGATSKLLPDADFTGHYEEDEFALAFARIEAHYFHNKGFFETDDQLLRNASRIRSIPGVIVQGRYDVVCPMESAWALHRAWPEADLIITPDSGHSAFDPPNTRALVAAADRFSGQ